MYPGDQNSYNDAMRVRVGAIPQRQLEGLYGKWTRAYTESVDGPYPEDVAVAPSEILDDVLKAINIVDAIPGFEIADKNEFARVLFAQIYGESSGHSCVFSGTGPAGMTQFTRATWPSIFKAMGLEAPTLQGRCDPWLATFAQVGYMAQLLHQSRKGGLRKALENYNGDVHKATYASNILKNADNDTYGFQSLMAAADTDGSIQNAFRVEYP